MLDRAPDDNRSPLSMLDGFVVGAAPLVIETPLSLPQATARLSGASDALPPDDESLYLQVNVKGAFVTAGYSSRALTDRVSGFESLMQYFQIYRPAFHGSVRTRPDGTELAGYYGLNQVSRLHGAAALISAAVLIASRWHAIGPVSFFCWFAIIGFVICCLLTRLNVDDLPYIERNLRFALDPSADISKHIATTYTQS